MDRSWLIVHKPNMSSVGAGAHHLCIPNLDSQSWTDGSISYDSKLSRLTPEAVEAIKSVAVFQMRTLP